MHEPNTGLPNTASPESDASGDSLTVEQAIAHLQGEDLGLRVYAAWWLGRFRINDATAIDTLIQALQDEDDRTTAGGYPLRRNAARALGKLGDRRAVPPLVACLSCSDFYVREAAAQALTSLGDPSCIPALLQLLESSPLPEPSADPASLAQPYDAILEALGELRAVEALDRIQGFLEHPVERISCAAARAMHQLTAHPHEASPYGERLVQTLSHPNLQLRRAALADLGAIGYLPAAEAIAQTLAENSLKLIALKGLLEKQLHNTASRDLSEGAIKVLGLMDTLL